MITRCSFMLAVLPALWLCAGCVAFQPADAAPGLNARERHALVEWYYWQPGRPATVYTDAYFDRLFARALDPFLDGERGEMLTSETVLALAEAGDEVFAAALARQPEAVRRAVTNLHLSYLWEHYRLHYPHTQTLFERPTPTTRSREQRLAVGFCVVSRA